MGRSVSPTRAAANGPHPPAAPDGAGHCEIRLKGHLDARWADWFGGLRLTRESDGTTVLRGPVVDQAALHGLLRKVGDLGLPLLSVTHREHNTTHNKRSTE